MSDESRPSPAFELVQHPNGTASVREIESGQAMHSVIGAWEEALLLYVQQSALRERFLAQSPEDSGAVVVLDVGMGIAANALCAIECRAKLNQDAPSAPTPLRPLQVLSFEHDLRGIELALQNPEAFPFLDRHREKVEALLKEHRWKSQDGSIEWKLFPGDFFQNIRPEMAPEVVFYDFYAPSSCPHLWSVESLTQVRKLGAHREARGLRMDLFTYSAATPIRAALVLAGFWVGYGTRTPSKAETTLASTSLKALSQPLGTEWLEKIQRSARPFPWGWPEEKRDFRILLEELGRSPHFRSNA